MNVQNHSYRHLWNQTFENNIQNGCFSLGHCMYTELFSLCIEWSRLAKSSVIEWSGPFKSWMPFKFQTPSTIQNWNTFGIQAPTVQHFVQTNSHLTLNNLFIGTCSFVCLSFCYIKPMFTNREQSKTGHTKAKNIQKLDFSVYSIQHHLITGPDFE